MIDGFVECFFALLAVTTVLPILPVLEEVTLDVPADQRVPYRLQALVQANASAVGFVLLAPFLFGALSLNLNHLRIAGGIVLLAFATHDILFSRIRRNMRQAHDEIVDIPPAIAPLGIPILVGPGVLSTLAVLAEVHGRLPVFAALGVNVALNALFVVLGDRLLGFMGEGVSRAVGKIMSLVLATLGAGMLDAGIRGAMG